jgi:hypothetical protein
MTRHFKKTIVSLEKAREWLGRYERGEGLKAIAHLDHFCIRTVTRQVERASEERRIEEARKAVLHSALEKHHHDLVLLADRMRRLVAAGLPLALEGDDVLLLQCLRQHQDRAPLWRHLQRYQTEFEKLRSAKDWPFLRDKMTHLRSIVLQQRPFIPISGPAESGGPEARAVSKGEGKAEVDAAGPYALPFSFESLDEAPLVDLIGDSRFTLRLDPGEFLGRSPEVRRLQRSLYEELTTIVMRRVVPGHCDYCPL